jgi:UTP--glucose-1-phosphate uridylyltransferase
MIEDLIIPCAGKGLRMKKINPCLPKELLCIGRKPMIQYAIEEAIDSKIKKIYIVINKDKEIIKEYLKRRLKIPFSLYFVYQQDYRGLSDAINCALKKIKQVRPFAVILPDGLFLSRKSALSQLIDAYQKEPSENYVALIRLKKGKAKFFQASGLVDVTKTKTNTYKINKFFPKKKTFLHLKSNFILKAFPRYIFQPKFTFIFNKFKDIKGEIDDVPILNFIANNNHLLGLELTGCAFDVGNPYGFEYCQKTIQKREKRI